MVSNGEDLGIEQGVNDPTDCVARTLEVITHSDELRGKVLGEVGEETRRTMVDINAYLALIESVTGLDREQVRTQMGCPDEANEPDHFSQTELHRSRSFLSTTSEAVLTASSPYGRLGALDLVTSTFRRVNGDTEFLKLITGSHDVRAAFALPQLDGATGLIDERIARGYVERFTGSGERVLLDPVIMQEFASVVLANPITSPEPGLSE